MKFSQDSLSNGYTIRGYASGSVTVTGPGMLPTNDDTLPLGEVLSRSFIISPSRLLTDWPPQHYGELCAEHFSLLLELKPELVLFGSGPAFRLPDPAWLAPLYRAGIGVESMDSGAACRTYNILAAEGRQVAAALLLP